jgi:hypothetical protein
MTTKLQPKHAIGGLLLLLGMISCGRPPADAEQPTSAGLFPGAAQPQQERKGIDKTRNAYVSAWKAGDASKIAELYTEDAGTWITATGRSHRPLVARNELSLRDCASDSTVRIRRKQQESPRAARISPLTMHPVPNGR